MSHFTRLKTKVTDREILIKTLQELNYSVDEECVFVEGFKGSKTDVEFVAKIPLSKDVGFRKNEDNTYEIIADWFGIHGISKQKFRQQVIQRYAYWVARDQLEKQGFSLISETSEKGEIRLLLRRMID